MAKSLTYDIEQRLARLKDNVEFKNEVRERVFGLMAEGDRAIEEWNKTRQELGITDEMLYGPGPAPVGEKENPFVPPKTHSRTVITEDGTEITDTRSGSSSVDFIPGRDY